MDFAALPPEINSGLMYMGAGAGPLLEAGAAWAELSTELSSAAQEYTSVIGTVEAVWQGPSAVAMTTAASRYLSWLYDASATALVTAGQATAAAAAYEAAFAATVPPSVIAANRAQLVALVATNWFGQNTPLIAAVEAQYMGMWAQDAAAMYTYQANSSAATSNLPQFTPPPQTTSGSTPAAATGPGGWLDNSTTTGQLIQAVISSGFPADFAQIFSNFIGYYTMAAAMVMSAESHASVVVPETPVTFTPQTTPGTTPKTTPVRAGMGAGGQVGRLTIPPSWAQPHDTKRTQIRVSAPTKDRYQAAIPAVPFVPVTTAGRSSQGRVREDPQYGHVSKVVPVHPLGG